MSHFVVVVAVDSADNIDDQLETILAPFEEETNDPEYTEFNDLATDEYYVETYNTRERDFRKLDDGTYESVYREFGLDIITCKPCELFNTIEDWLAVTEADSFDEDLGKYGYYHNPNAKWDWYSIGGRWKGYFSAKPGVTGEVGESGVFGNDADYGHFDIIRKGDIDFNTKYQNRRNEALANYRKLVEVLDEAGLTFDDYVSWDTILQHYGEERIQDAREAYNGQPFKKALWNKHQTEKAKGNDEYAWIVWLDADYLKLMAGDPVKYAESVGKGSIIPYAILDEEGWHSKGEMGWFGISSDEDDNWIERAWARIMGYPDDKILVAVDCHI